MALTQQQMIEMIQEQFPDEPETKIRAMLNQALLEFGEKTRILNWQSDTVALQAAKVYYPFSLLSGITDADQVLGVHQVDFDDEPMYEFSGFIQDTDITEAS